MDCHVITSLTTSGNIAPKQNKMIPRELHCNHVEMAGTVRGMEEHMKVSMLGRRHVVVLSGRQVALWQMIVAEMQLAGLTTPIPYKQLKDIG